MTKIILTDSCFWLGLVDPNDQFHEQSNTIAEMISGYSILFPWPCLYETMSTHLARRRDRLLYFETIIKKPEIILFDEKDYRTNAINEVFKLNSLSGFTYSLADSVIREILKDINIKIDFLVTFNTKDFHDVCQRRKIQILD